MFHILFYLIIQYNQKKTSKNNEKKMKVFQSKRETHTIPKYVNNAQKFCNMAAQVPPHRTAETILYFVNDSCLLLESGPTFQFPVLQSTPTDDYCLR